MQSSRMNRIAKQEMKYVKSSTILADGLPIVASEVSLKTWRNCTGPEELLWIRNDLLL
jgi:hypothetical protein